MGAGDLNFADPRLLENTIADLRDRIDNLELGYINVASIDHITQDLGDQRSGTFYGEFIAPTEDGYSTVGDENFSGLWLSENGFRCYEHGDIKVQISRTGESLWGSDISSPATTSVGFFVSAETYNGEALAAGAALLGNNSSGKANLLWDPSTGQLLFRGGTTPQVTVDTDGTIYAGGQAVALNSDGLKIKSSAFTGFRKQEAISFVDKELANDGMVDWYVFYSLDGSIDCINEMVGNARADRNFGTNIESQVVTGDYLSYAQLKAKEFSVPEDPTWNTIGVKRKILSGGGTAACAYITRAGLWICGDANPVFGSGSGTSMDDVDVPRGDAWIDGNLKLGGAFQFSGFTMAELPAAGTAGRLAWVTDGPRGLWMDQGTQWFSLGGGVYNVQEFGAVPDGETDCSAAVAAALEVMDAAEGGALLFPPGIYLILDFPAIPNDGASVPHQKSFRLTGGGSSNNFQGNVAGGAVLDIRNSSGVAKIDLRGIGLFELDHLTLEDGGNGNLPFLQATNTTLHIHDCFFVGTHAGAAADQDAIVLGGTDTTSDGSDDAPFAGYGTIIERNTLHQIRRGVYGRTYCNGVVVRANSFTSSCGSNLAGGAAIELLGYSTIDNNHGNSIESNLIEMNHYPYGIKVEYAASNHLQGNSFYDPGAGCLAYIRFEAHASENFAFYNYAPTSYSHVSDANGNNSYMASSWTVTCQVANLMAFGFGTPAAQVHVFGIANRPELILQEYSGQTTDAFQLKNSSGSTLANMTVAGIFNLPGMTSTQSAAVMQDGSGSTGIDETFDNTWEAVKITTAGSEAIRSFALRIKASAGLSNTTATLTGYLYTDVAGSPGAAVGGSTSSNLYFGNITTSYQEFQFYVGSLTLSASTSYWAVLKRSAAPTGGNILIDSAATGSNTHAYSANGTAWTLESSKDCWFKIYGATGIPVNVTSTSNYAFYGYSVNANAITGFSVNSAGGYFWSDNYAGVLGSSNYGTGGRFISIAGWAIYSTSTSGGGGYFSSSSSTAVRGDSTTGLACSFTVTPSSTNNLSSVGSVVRSTSGTPAAGIGGTLDFWLPNASLTSGVRARYGWILTTATAGAEDCAFVWYTQTGGTTAAERMRLTAPGNLLIGDTTDDGVRLNVVMAQASTNTIIEMARFEAQVSGAGVGAAGFGVSAGFYAESATNNSFRQLGQVDFQYVVATDASFTTRARLMGMDSAALREAFRWETTGSEMKISFFGAAAVVQASHIADPAGGGTVDAEARSAIGSILVMAENYGLLKTS